MNLWGKPKPAGHVPDEDQEWLDYGPLYDEDGPGDPEFGEWLDEKLGLKPHGGPADSDATGWIAAAWPLIFIPIDRQRVPSMSEAGGFLSWLGTALSTLKTGEPLRQAMSATFLVSGALSALISGRAAYM